MAINERLVHTTSAAAGGGTGNQEEGLILHLDANDVDSYDGDGDVWYDIKDHEYTTSINIDSNFKVLNWDGNGTSQDIPTGFKPDFFFAANTNLTTPKIVQDSVRGLSQYWETAPGDSNDFQTVSNFVTSFNTNSTSIGNGWEVNNNNNNYRGLALKAGDTEEVNNDGTQTTTVSVNADIGFSIVKGSGNLNGNTYGHGLGVKPKLVILKSDGQAQALMHHNEAGGYFEMNNGNYSTSNSTPINTSLVSSFTGYSNTVSDKSLYCFAEKRGFSKIGTYDGTSAASNKVYCGFEPAFVMVRKLAGGISNGFFMFDNLVNPTNPRTEYQNFARSEILATDSAGLDFNGDGFTINSTDTVLNGSGSRFMFVAFAKNTNETSLIPDTDLELHLDAADFDGSTNTPTTWTDKTSNGNNGTISGATFDSELGNWLDFDGSNDYVEISNASSIIPAGSSFSVEVWVNAKSNTENKYWGVVSTTNGTSPYGGWMIYNHHNTDNWGIALNKSGTWTSLDSGVDIVPNKWVHLAYTYDGYYMKLYVNGELRFNSYQLGSLQYNSGSQNIYIGRNHTNYSPIKVGQVRIYGSATLTQAQIRQNFNFTKNNYPNGFDGTITSATWNSAGYFNFDGNGDYISLNQGNNMSGGFFNNFSISYWVKLDTTSTLGRHFYAHSSSSNYIILYYNHSLGGMRLGGSNINTQQASYTMSADTWYHIVVTQSSENISLYVNTSRKINSNQSIGIYDDMKVTLGAADQSGSITDSLDGKISKFKLYDKILTTTEIDTLYNEGA